MALWACMWCVLVYFISNISKPPSFKTLRLHMNKSKSLLLPALPHLLRSTLQSDCLGQRGSLGTPQTTHWCPDSWHSSSLVLCETRVGSHSMSVTHLPDWFYCFLKAYWTWKQSLLYRIKHKVWKQFEACLLMKAFGLFFLWNQGFLQKE